MKNNANFYYDQSKYKLITYFMLDVLTYMATIIVLFI